MFGKHQVSFLPDISEPLNTAFQCDFQGSYGIQYFPDLVDRSPFSTEHVEHSVEYSFGSADLAQCSNFIDGETEARTENRRGFLKLAG